MELPKPELLQAIRRLAQRSLEFESSDKCPSRDRLASVLMLETRASVTVYLEMFLIFLFGKSFLKWPSTVVMKCRHPSMEETRLHLLAGGSVREALRGLSSGLLPEVKPPLCSLTHWLIQDHVATLTVRTLQAGHQVRKPGQCESSPTAALPAVPQLPCL